MEASSQHTIAVETPAGVVEYRVVQIERAPDGTVYMTLQNGPHSIEVEKVYPATFMARDWSMTGELIVLARAPEDDAATIKGTFRRRQPY